MQYLSRAYQYYSGINPATLTGAIDVIVVRRKDEDGNDVYSCSPFHVRFGKLQVLRAGEKRVKLQLPDSLPSPHEAPFWMKVGEAGEAFFVVETDEEVPEELQTSPVMSATDVSPPVSPDFSGREGEGPDGKNNLSATQEPFGRGQGGISITNSPGALQPHEPEFLDLNDELPLDQTDSQQHASLEATPRPPSKPLTENDNKRKLQIESDVPVSKAISSASPSTILNAASHLLPSFLHSSPPTPKSEETNKSTRYEKEPQTIPPNPLESPAAAHELLRAQKISAYVREHKVAHSRSSSVSSFGSGRSKLGPGPAGENSFGDRADAHLPQVAAGEGDGPEVEYREDAVLDAMGYHANTSEAPEHGQSAEEPSDAEAAAIVSAQVLSENMSLGDSITVDSENHLVQFAQDLLISAGTPASDLKADKQGSSQDFRTTQRITSQTVVAKEIARRLNSLSLESSPGADPDTESLEQVQAGQGDTRLVPRREDFNRGQSEPPPATSQRNMLSLPRMESPPPYSEQGPADYTWEWGGFPTKTPGANEQTFDFSSSLSPMQEDSKVADPVDAHVQKLRDHNQSRSNSIPVVSKGQNGIANGGRPRLDTGHAHTDPVLPDDAHVQHVNEQHGHLGKLKNDEEDPYKFMLDTLSVCHTFELSLSAPDDDTDAEVTDAEFNAERITFRRFVEDPSIVDQPNLVIKYGSSYLTWQNASPVLAALAVYRRSLLPPAPSVLPAQKSQGNSPASVSTKPSKGYAWSRWWRRGESAGIPLEKDSSPAPAQATSNAQSAISNQAAKTRINTESPDEHQNKKYYAKTLRLTSDQLKSLNLQQGANKVVFSVTSSYSGVASCTSRIFLWEEDDHVVISDIDGTITKSDALGHVFAAIGRDWTHLGVAKLYTDICNNGYKIMYLTSRAIGQADSTRDYLRGISQGSYQLPEGPVIMSPDRLFTSLHREVIMRKPEIFKMACLRDIQRLFGNGAKTAFYAGFGNRITDAMSYRSVNVPSSRIFTIDSGGEVKMELLELAGYKSSYIHMTDLVDQMFPPVNRKWQPEYTDFNYWRPSLPDIPLPDLTPVSPALSATSDSSRLGLLRNMASGIARRASRQTITSDGSKDGPSQTSRPTSPLVGPSVVAGDYDVDSVSEPEDVLHDQTSSMPGSLPGSFDNRADYLNDEFFDQRYRDEFNDRPRRHEGNNVDLNSDDDDDGYDHDERVGLSEDDVDPEMFDDDLLATGEMSKVPF
ncbi:hypothetical protein NliqN6_4954 [Naganishia liquefaciens]|uniref:phosphatidate phosphatase n=1 Tax=Naganishia liquefaciens TaxID=104408 RepID=A0A8H3TWQ8_9TREE|nr:hypothetical protein NliqN6_4954 [Naganishia liquefaciens]